MTTATAGVNDGGQQHAGVIDEEVKSRNNVYDRNQISSEVHAFLSGSSSTGPRSEVRAFFTVWMFLTRLPSPSYCDLHPGYLMRGMSYFPVVGSILGCFCAIVYDFMKTSLGLPSNAAATLTLAFGVYLTGCFHEDGLADTADGMGGWSKSQMLKIMTDSRLGTFGVLALCLFTLIKTQLIGHLGTSQWEVGRCSGAGPAILVAQTLARLAAPYLIRTREYVAEVGPKSPFYLFMVEAKHIVSWPRVIFATLFCFSISTALYGQAFTIVLLLVVLVVAHMAGNKGDYLLGGVMGDYLGATICICEATILIVIVARRPIVESYQVVMNAFTAGDDSMLALYGNDRLRPIIHIVLLFVSLVLWCSFVGSPDMYDREVDKKEDIEKKD